MGKGQRLKFERRNIELAELKKQLKTSIKSEKNFLRAGNNAVVMLEKSIKALKKLILRRKMFGVAIIPMKLRQEVENIIHIYEEVKRGEYK